jgi:hypothetical protein
LKDKGTIIVDLLTLSPAIPLKRPVSVATGHITFIYFCLLKILHHSIEITLPGVWGDPPACNAISWKLRTISRKQKV